MDDKIMQLEDVQGYIPQQETPQQQPEETIEAQESEQSEQKQTAAQQRESEQARNFKQINDARKRAELERDEAVRILREIQLRQQPQVQQQSPEEDDNLGIGLEDVAEGKHVKKVYNEVRELKKQLRQYQQQSNESVAEAKLRSSYPDADKILSQENINAFRDKFPEMASTIYNSSGDVYSKLVSAYTMIKNLGVHQEDLYQTDRSIAQKNAAKPRTVTSISPQSGDTPLSKANAFANGLTPDLQKQLLEEMNRSRKGY